MSLLATTGRSALATLIRRLGGEPLPAPASHDGTLLVAGTLGGLPIWTLATPGQSVRQAARRAGRAGALGVVIAADADGRWTIAATPPPARPVAIAAGAADALPLTRLAAAARQRRATALEQAIAFASALDVDAAGRRTFRTLHGLIERAVSLLPHNVPREIRHDWALTQLTRLLFLRFVEAEGWLDGNRRFLGDEFDRCLLARRDPTRHFLDPLFFGTLNRPPQARSRFARAFGAVPFLNGGLFEAHAVERRWRLRLPVAYWRDVFESLVERVNVSLDADADAEHVTPELLGRVFEGVMHPAERREEGAYYTPPALVDAVLVDALSCHLADRLAITEAEGERRLLDPDRATREILLDIAVLDPAAGSGAFLVGALGALHGPGPREPRRVRRLVARSLFGVDRHPGAVRICELRLWLEVLRAMRGRTPARITPLPNLDTQIRAGDALLDPLGHAAISNAAMRRLRAMQQAIASAHGAAKRQLIAEWHRSERRVTLDALDASLDSAERAIAEIFDAARSRTLFGDRTRLTADAIQTLAAQRRFRTTVRAERRRLARDASSAPFALEAAFAPALARRGGFDLVIGNPPWVRAERLPERTRASLGERYRWWRGSRGGGWHHQPDLAVAFLERGASLLREGGTLAYLLPAKLATAGYARAARAALESRFVIRCAADLAHDPRAGFDATVYPLALVATRRRPSGDEGVRLGLARDSTIIAQQSWRDGVAWRLAAPELQQIADRLARAFPSLGEQWTPQLGVKTGANALFLDPPADLHPWTRPVIRARDVRPFRANVHHRILWPADDRGRPWAALPAPVAERLSRHFHQLRRRADHGTGPAWQLFRVTAATAEHRVVWRDLARQLEAVALTGSTIVPLNSCYVIAVSTARTARTLTAYFNSTPARVLARSVAEPAAGGCARFGARVISQLPLPPSLADDDMLDTLDASAESDVIQAALDGRVAAHLALSDDECEVIARVAARRR